MVESNVKLLLYLRKLLIQVIVSHGVEQAEKNTECPLHFIHLCYIGVC